MKKARSRKRSFRKRIRMLFVSSLVGISLFVVLFSTVLLWGSVIHNAQTLALRQEETIVGILEQEVASLYQLGQLTIRSGTLLEHVSHLPGEVDNYAVLNNDLFGTLLDTKSLNSNIQQVMLLKYEDLSLYQVGGAWLSPVRSHEMYATVLKTLDASTQTPYTGMRAFMGPAYADGTANALSLMFPIFDPVNVYQKRGLLCLCVRESVFRELLDNSLFADACLVDAQGTLLSSTDGRTVGDAYSLDFTLSQASGVDSQGNTYRIWMRLPSLGWTLVVSATLMDLVGGTLRFLTLMLVLVLLFCVAIAIVCFFVMKNFLRPLSTLEDSMGAVAGGDMSVRMDTQQYQDEEFRNMASSFNKMVHDVQRLMERVKEEQTQVKQIELNALQSQIKPHFLYNTLECIHWQALLEGDKKTSRLIKALASFYRLCLSKGQDLVTLRQELAHVDSYLIIQNARYSDIIDCQVNVPSALLDTMIPKMTLQPLVENAIYHGIRVKEGFHGRVTISAKRAEDTVIVSVMDNGEGIPPEKLEELNATLSVFDEKYGYGVRNVHRRLEIMFGKPFGLHYAANDADGCHVDVCLPAQGGNVDVSCIDRG